MNQKNLWKFIIVVLVLVWSFFQSYPPAGKKLGDVFQANVIPNRIDATYSNIVANFKRLEQANPGKTDYANLTEAIGTNDIARYFPNLVDAKEELNPNKVVLNRLQQMAAGKIKLGIDLQGGTEFLVQADYSKINGGTNAGATNSAISDNQKSVMLSEAVEVLRNRVDQLGVSEPVIQPEGEDRILIQLPGLSEDVKEDARKRIQEVAYLEIRLVDANPDSANLISQGLTEPGYELLRIKEKDGKGNPVVNPYLIKKRPELTGNHIKNAMVVLNEIGQPEIDFTLTPEGRDIFAKVTTDNTGHYMAVVLDGKLVSIARIKEPIETGSVRISGSFTETEAQELASALNNPLQVPVKIMSESSVDPTLGRDTVASGVRSAIIGTVLVAGFMAVYYLLAGLVADVALIMNIIILLGVMCSIGTTLTLPGIAGVVLTIGMAVDANVLIFERIREESAKGKSLRGALSAGYDRAFGTIFDSHVTTLISSVILIFMGTGPIKGFGVTLTIGVAASLFTALVVTRLIFDFTIARGWVKSLKMLHFFAVTKIDFMKIGWPAFIATWTLIVIGLGYGAWRGQNMMGIDFAGGDSVRMTFSEKVDPQQIRSAITKIPEVKDPVIQYQRDAGGGTEILRITSPSGTADRIVAAVTKGFPAAKFVPAGVERVGATIGSEIQIVAISASALSLLGILFYVAIRYEFTFAVGAVVAVFHDVLMTIGCYCLTGLFGEGRQFNATMVAAVLTIIGFSINDTIVIFDRIREDLKLGVRGSFKDIINQALNQTLSRTIITSGTVFLATLSLYLFGGGAINDFAFTFLVGIITGTYSSIYIASFLVLLMHKGQRPKMGSQVAMTTNAAVSSSRA